MNSRIGRLSFACAATTLLGIVSAFAQSVEWSGGALATSNAWGQAANWVGGVAPASGANIRIASGSFTPATNATDTMSLNADRTIGSLTFDNSAGQFPSQLRLNANAGNGTTTRTLFLNRDASNVVFDLTNNANVFISGNSSTLTTNFSGLNLTLNYTGMGIINVDGSSSLTIGGNAATLRGNGTTAAGLQKTGAGNLTLGGASANYTGGFQLSGGTLWVAASSNTTNSAQPGPFGTGTLTIDGGTKLASTINSTSNVFRIFDNPVNFTGGTVTLGDTTNNGGISFTTVFNNSAASTFSGNTVLNVLSTVTMNRAMSGPGSFTKAGAGTLTLSAAASYTGGTVLQGGTLQLQTSDKLPTDGNVTFDGGALRVSTAGFTTSNHTTTITSNGATFNLAGGISLNWVGDISGAGALSTSGSGSTATLTLSGNNTYSGGTTITAGTVKGSVGTGSVDVATGATYDLNSADRAVSGLTGGGNVTLGANTLSTGSGSFSGLITGTGGVTKTGSGTLTLSGANTYSGATTVNGGTLAGSIGSGDLAVATGATYDLGGANRSVTTLSGAGSITLGANSLITNSTVNSTFSGAISGAGGFTKDGTSTLTLSGANTYSGPTTVTAGSLTGSVSNSDLSVATGATYDLGGANRSVAALSGAGSVVLGSNTLTTNSSASSTFSGAISGTGGLTKDGAGSLALSGANTYTGATTVSAGTLSGAISSGDLSVASGATYDLGGADRSVAALSGNGGVTLGANSLTTTSSANSTFSGSVTGTGGLTKAGSGTLTLTGSNTYTGPTALTSGGLKVNGTLASSLTVASGTTLSGTGSILGAVSISGIHNPGNSPGLQTFASLTYNTGATINWELGANSVTGAGTNFDQIVVNGDVNFAGATSLNLVFNSAGSSVNWSDPLWYQDRSWTVIDPTNTLNFSNLALNLTNWTDSVGQNFSTSLGNFGASFNLQMLGGNVMLNYTAGAVPEPSTYAMLVLGAGMLAFGAWRRRRRA